MSQKQLSRPRGNKKTLVIGFDFGTHSTKVVLRERGKEIGRIAEFDKFAKRYPPFTSPSVVRQIGDKLFFGTTALNAAQGKIYSSLKVKLLSSSQLNETPLTGELDSVSLVTVYLAWAFQQIRNSLHDKEYANIFLNLAAPMSHFENSQLKTRYLRIVQAAWKLTFEMQTPSIKQGVTVAQVTTLLEPLLTAPVQDGEHRHFDVLPETIAPVVSLSLDPWMEPGMYMIVDTGAGTTEISVFHAEAAGVDQKVLCYWDETMLLGGNDLNLRKQSPGDGQTGKSNQIVEEIAKRFCEIWYRGYLLDSLNHTARNRWKSMTLVLSGGGTRHIELVKKFSNLKPMFARAGFEPKTVTCRHSPATLELPVGMDDDDGSLFAVANGLAIERKHWPIIFEPNQIEPMEPTQEVENKPQGYWYLDAK